MTEYIAPITLEVTAPQSGETALNLLSTSSGLSKQRIKDAMNKGAVWWTKKNKMLRLRRASQVLEPGTRLALFYDPQVLTRIAEAPTLIADTRRYSVWFKPHGLLSQGSQWGDHCSILRWAEVHLQPKRACFLIHRLDGDAAGLLLLAHDSQSAARLSQLFQDHNIQKKYQARVTGLVNITGEEKIIAQVIDGKSAITHIKLLQQDTNLLESLLDIRIETGRKHQIRRHLADLGHPIIGDRLYGKTNKRPLQLLAYQLEFVCPFTKKLMNYTLPQEQMLT